jgi:hypothetical protein
MSFVELLEGADSYTTLAEVSATEVQVDAPGAFQPSDTFSISATSIIVSIIGCAIGSC